MKCIIAGSRELCGFDRKLDPELWDEHANIFTDTMDVCPFIEEITEVVSGKARGTDTLGELWAKIHGIDIKPFPANWNKFKKAAGPIRNQEMCDYCLTSDALIAILRVNSKGTQDMIDRAKKKGLRVFVNLVEFKSYEEKHGSRNRTVGVCV